MSLGIFVIYVVWIDSHTFQRALMDTEKFLVRNKPYGNNHLFMAIGNGQQ